MSMDPGDAAERPAVDGLLRTGELLQLRVADIMMNNQLTFATIDLPDTIGIRDSVSVTTALLRLITRFIQTKQLNNMLAPAR